MKIKGYCVLQKKIHSILAHPFTAFYYHQYCPLHTFSTFIIHPLLHPTTSHTYNSCYFFKQARQMSRTALVSACAQITFDSFSHRRESFTHYSHPNTNNHSQINTILTYSQTHDKIQTLEHYTFNTPRFKVQSGGPTTSKCVSLGVPAPSNIQAHHPSFVDFRPVQGLP